MAMDKDCSGQITHASAAWMMCQAITRVSIEYHVVEQMNRRSGSQNNFLVILAAFPKCAVILTALPCFYYCYHEWY